MLIRSDLKYKLLERLENEFPQLKFRLSDELHVFRHRAHGAKVVSWTLISAPKRISGFLTLSQTVHKKIPLQAYPACFNTEWYIDHAAEPQLK